MILTSDRCAQLKILNYKSSSHEKCFVTQHSKKELLSQTFLPKCEIMGKD